MISSSCCSCYSIAGFCGTSIAVEPGDDELEDEIIPNDYAWVKQEDLEKNYDKHGGLQPQNKFTPEEKLGKLHSIYIISIPF